MLQQEDRAYYARRTVDERAQAELAINATAAAIHYDLAHRYALLASGKRPGRARFRLVEGGGVPSPQAQPRAVTAG